MARRTPPIHSRFRWTGRTRNEWSRSCRTLEWIGGVPFQIPVDGSHAQRVVPELSNSLTAEARPLAYFVLYPDASNPEKPKLQVQFLAGGKLLSEQTADVPAPNASGGIPMVVQVAARPGDCELRVTIHQGTASATQTLAYKADSK